MQIMKIVKREMMEALNFEIKTKSERSEKKKKRTYKYLGILEADTNKRVVIKEKE